MTRLTKLIVALVAATIAVAAAPATAQPADATSSDAEAVAAAIEDIDPLASAAATERPIDAPFGKAWLGAADGDVTLVVFADYACPACREAQAVLDHLIAADPKLKIVYRILVNEEDGRDAARTSLAIAQGNADWATFHRALDAGGAPTRKRIDAALTQAGIARPALAAVDADTLIDDPVFEELLNNDRLIVLREGKAVPAWLIGDGSALNGFDVATLTAAIAKARDGTPAAR